MDEPVHVLDITVADWQPKLGEIGEVVVDIDDIDQCIRTILVTQKGSVAHEPDFGSDLWRYIDWPIDQARPHVVREILDAIARWEPRIEVLAVTFGPGDELGTALIEISRRRRLSNAQPSVLALKVAA